MVLAMPFNRFGTAELSQIFLCATNQLNGKPGVGAARLEHHRILVNCNAIPSLYTLPTSLEELGAALKVAGVDSWIATDLFDALCKACPEPESHKYRQWPYYRVHYDEVTSPDNMISLGDATVSLNPIYGPSCK